MSPGWLLLATNTVTKPFVSHSVSSSNCFKTHTGIEREWERDKLYWQTMYKMSWNISCVWNLVGYSVNRKIGSSVISFVKLPFDTMICAFSQKSVSQFGKGGFKALKHKTCVIDRRCDGESFNQTQKVCKKIMICLQSKRINLFGVNSKLCWI